MKKIVSALLIATLGLASVSAMACSDHKHKNQHKNDTSSVKK